MRIFLSADTPCNGGCKYCFAKWAEYPSQTQLQPKQLPESKGRVILYPCCDGDCFHQNDLLLRTTRLTDACHKVYISISSKSFPSEEQVRQWYKLHKSLVGDEKGFLKFAISISNRSMIDILEPSTMSYDERIDLARFINSLGIPLSLTIKPVLPFISKEEYRSILTDFRPYLRHVLIGGLYVNKTTSFYRDYLQNYECTKRKVGWIQNNPEWDYIEDSLLMESIQSDAKQIDMQVFLSDKELLESMAQEQIEKHGNSQ